MVFMIKVTKELIELSMDLVATGEELKKSIPPETVVHEYISANVEFHKWILGEVRKEAESKRIIIAN
jgi:hypothetical protein